MNDDALELFAERVRIAMRARGITKVKHLAEQAGLPPTTVGVWLNDSPTGAKSWPRADHAFRLAAFLDVSLDYLAGRTDNPDGLREGLCIVDDDALDATKQAANGLLEQFCDKVYPITYATQVPRGARYATIDEARRLTRSANDSLKEARPKDLRRWARRLMKWLSDI